MFRNDIFIKQTKDPAKGKRSEGHTKKIYDGDWWETEAQIIKTHDLPQTRHL